jgi:hypothetical protein
MIRERTWWQRLVYDKELERRRREERTLRNSAVFGLGGLVSGVGYAVLCIFAQVADIFSLALAALITGLGAVRVWRGAKRWRAGGEFNLPGTPGPTLLQPPEHTRGD